MRSVKYWQNLGKVLNTAKQKIPKKCRIGDTCFTLLKTIAGNLYTRHLKNLNHAHKDVNDLLSVIIILETYVHGGETFFKMELLCMILGKEHMILSIHTEDVWVVPLIKFYTMALFGMEPDQLFIFSFTNQNFLHFVHHSAKFYDKYINTDDRRKYIDYDGTGIFSKQKVRNIFNEKYKDTYGNRDDIVSSPYIKDTRMRRVYPGRKRKATGFVYLQGSSYRDAEGSSHLRSCLNDAIINASPRIGQKLTNWSFIDSDPLEY